MACKFLPASQVLCESLSLRLDYVLLETRLSLLLAVSSLFCAAVSSSRWLFSRVTAIFHQGLGLSSSKLSEMPAHFANHSYRNRSRRCLFSLLLSLFFLFVVSLLLVKAIHPPEEDAEATPRACTGPSSQVKPPRPQVLHINICHHSRRGLG